VCVIIDRVLVFLSLISQQPKRLIVMCRRAPMSSLIAKRKSTLVFKLLSRVSSTAVLRKGSSSRYAVFASNRGLLWLLLNYLAKAIGIALESHRLDIISSIYSKTKDINLLSYAMEGVLDTGFSLSYRDQVLRFLFPLFPRPTAGDGSPHVHALTRMLVTLSDPSLTIPLLSSLVRSEQLLAYQFAFDLVEGGSQDFLETLRTDLPEGDQVIISIL